MRVQLGERVRFLPTCFNRDDTENMVAGRIVYINRQHRYYLAGVPRRSAGAARGVQIRRRGVSAWRAERKNTTG